MFRFFVFFFLLCTVYISKCDPELRIFKNIEEVYSPLEFAIGERIGSNFSLICELKSSQGDIYDDQISWGKATPQFSFNTKEDLEELANKKSKELYSFLKQSETNKATKIFSPLRIEDNGRYFCASFKYMLFKVVFVIVNTDMKSNFLYKKSRKQTFMDRLFHENLYCSDKMFMCMSNGACINQHYVCDGKKDCRDGSDESFDKCNGDPCKDKLLCDDGRCIPQSWCCDKHYDSGCTVTFRPTCCQISADPYGDYEYVPDVFTQIKTSGILATFFSVVLILLILSKILIFTNKTQVSNNLLRLHELPHNQRNYRDYDYRARQPLTIRSINDRRNINLNIGVLDPLLLTRENLRGNVRQQDLFVDNPPSYTEVVTNLDSGLCEPPPPYTSTEFLNENRDASVNPSHTNSN